MTNQFKKQNNAVEWAFAILSTPVKRFGLKTQFVRILYKMNRKTTDFQQRYSFSSINTRDDTVAEDQSENGGEHGIIVCLLNKNGTLGAAYYNFDDKTVSYT